MKSLFCLTLLLIAFNCVYSEEETPETVFDEKAAKEEEADFASMGKIISDGMNLDLDPDAEGDQEEVVDLGDDLDLEELNDLFGSLAGLEDEEAEEANEANEVNEDTEVVANEEDNIDTLFEDALTFTAEDIDDLEELMMGGGDDEGLSF